MLDQSNVNVIVIVIFTLIMLYFAYKDSKSYKSNSHQDYKSLIVSTGVLGTFIGIFIGLLGFDTANIKESVPLLLEGLKTAFITSIGGMAISILLSATQKSSGLGQAEDELAMLSQIHSKLSNLDTLSLMNTKLDSITTNTKHLEILPLMNTKLDSLDTNIKHLSNDISSVKEEMRSNQKMLFEFLETSLNNVNRTLEEAIEVLAEGATKEIIKALENVIQDFNKNLTDQFGDNFKQLNEAVKNMIEWQNNYKTSIEKIEENIKTQIQLLETSSSSLNSISESTHKMSDNYSQLNTTSEKLEKVISTNENQINNLEKHLEVLASIGDKVKVSIESIDTFSEKIQTSLSGQSEALTKLTNDINKQLPDSLDELNKALTTLTNKFRNDYEYFLEQVSKLMASSNR